MQRVKIVATIGPASSSPEVIRGMIAAGVDVARLNFSHGTHAEHRAVFETVRAEAERAGAHVAILADLCGPKIRTGAVRGGSVDLVEGAAIEVVTETVLGTAERVSTTYESLPDDVGAGDRILIDDGLLELEVVEIADRGVRCRVVVGGTLKDHKGMNIPGTPLSTPALTAKDRDDLAFARELGVDFFALSFVRRPEDVVEAKSLAGTIPVIAKIEKPEAIVHLSGIIDVADGLMVARGDLGVEAGAEKVPLLQKRIINDAAVRGLPVIVATQMLDSMIRNPRPTRAEVSDVANAVLDGADAVMLSGETAAGKYPLEAVRTMATVLGEVERSELFERQQPPLRVSERSFSNAIARAAVQAAADLGLRALAIYSETGHSAALVSACRPLATVIGLSRHPEILRRLALRWGVIPIHADWVEGVTGVVRQAERKLLELGAVAPGDDIAVTFGMQDMSGPGRTDVLKLWRVQG
ncbi:MAG TPA: pyruvate kinase [Polyangia bacterium]|nr:pyruvate kinase [Polyangia bacterium]